jgi:GT2 family glycosyltransferase
VEDSDVSAVVCIYKPTSDQLNRCLNSLLTQVSEIIVCSDMAGEVPGGAMTHPKIRYVRMPKADVGYGRKLNYAFRHTVTKWVLAVNDDVYLDPDAVQKMREAAAKDERAAVVGCLLWYPGRTSIQHGGTRRLPGDIGWGHINHKQAHPTIKDVVEMENVTGAACLINRKAFYQVDGMDEDFRLYFEDNSFCMAIRRAGWKILYTPFAQGIHEEHQSTNKTPEMASTVEKSRRLFIEKWGQYFTANPDVTKIGNFDYK